MKKKRPCQWNRSTVSERFLQGLLGQTLIESLSKDVFRRRMSTGSEVFSLTICLDAKKFVLISFFSLIRATYLRVSTKPPPNDAKRPLPVDVRRSKTLLLKLPINSEGRLDLGQIDQDQQHRITLKIEGKTDRKAIIIIDFVHFKVWLLQCWQPFLLLLDFTPQSFLSCFI